MIFKRLDLEYEENFLSKIQIIDLSISTNLQLHQALILLYSNLVFLLRFIKALMRIILNPLQSQHRSISFLHFLLHHQQLCHPMLYFYHLNPARIKHLLASSFSSYFFSFFSSFQLMYLNLMLHLQKFIKLKMGLHFPNAKIAMLHLSFLFKLIEYLQLRKD